MLKEQSLIYFIEIMVHNQINNTNYGIRYCEIARLMTETC